MRCTCAGSSTRTLPFGPQRHLRRLATAAAQGEDIRELPLQPAEDRLDGLGERRLRLAADPRVAGAVVLRLRRGEPALPQELQIAVDQREPVDGVPHVEL